MLFFGVGRYGILGLNFGGFVESFGFVLIFYLFDIGSGIFGCGDILVLLEFDRFELLLMEIEGVEIIVEIDCDNDDEIVGGLEFFKIGVMFVFEGCVVAFGFCSSGCFYCVNRDCGIGEGCLVGFFIVFVGIVGVLFD